MAMDRPEPGLIKWSPNAERDSFLHLNLQHRVVQLYEPTGHAQRGRFDYRKISKHDEVPPLTTYDWSPSIPGLVAVGTSTGVVNLLRVDDNSNDYKLLSTKVARTCLAVAFNTTGLLAVGLDRVRNDTCLHIWDVNRLSRMHDTGPGFLAGVELHKEPWKRLEQNASISSIKFFEDNPLTLVVGIKGSGLRVHDLREGHESVTNFQTKCNNNLAIDYADQNYFASSALDSPGVMVWDRRALSRSVASTSYLEAVDMDAMPLGAALRLDRAMDMERDPQARSARNSFIRKLAYSRDQRGMLAVLSRTGQLKVFLTQKAAFPPDDAASDGPQLMQVRRSLEMDNLYSEPDRKSERIVSFDWITMRSPSLRPRLLVLRNSGAFETVEVPGATRSYAYHLTPWQAPYRGMEGELLHTYHGLMQFEPEQTKVTLGPLFVDTALSDVSIFGPDKDDAALIAKTCMEAPATEQELLVDETVSSVPLPDSFAQAKTLAERLKILRKYVWTITHQDLNEEDFEFNDNPEMLARFPSNGQEEDSTHSSRSLHESLLKLTMETIGLPKPAMVVLDHIMLIRAKENYLLDSQANCGIVDDDPWLKAVWGWIKDAEEACLDGGMRAHPLDLSYFGVHSIWTEDLGERPTLRLAEGSGPPDKATWTRCLSAICRRRELPRFNGVESRKPFHRQLLLDICSWGAFDRLEQTGDSAKAGVTAIARPSTWYTRRTALALFQGHSEEAIQQLKEGSKAHPELLFVSLALQLVSRGDRGEAEQLDVDEVVAAKTDPYLRAISSYIATGDWTTIAKQRSLPLRARTFVAVRNFDDDRLSAWLAAEVADVVAAGDIEGVVLTGITEKTVDLLAAYVAKFHDVQTAALVMAFAAPRYLDDYRATAWRTAYRAYLQRHRAFFQRARFEVECTKRSKRDPAGRPTIKPPSRQLALRCVYCDAATSLLEAGRPSSTTSLAAHAGSPATSAGPYHAQQNGGGGPTSVPSYSDKMAPAASGIACPNCKRHLPRCVVCLEVVGVPRSDTPALAAAADPEASSKLVLSFPSFCLRCEHVLHLDHARQWFARHNECPVPECRCRCNFRANPELSYR